MVAFSFSCVCQYGKTAVCGMTAFKVKPAAASGAFQHWIMGCLCLFGHHFSLYDQEAWY